MLGKPSIRHVISAILCPVFQESLPCCLPSRLQLHLLLVPMQAGSPAQSKTPQQQYWQSSGNPCLHPKEVCRSQPKPDHQAGTIILIEALVASVNSIPQPPQTSWYASFQHTACVQIACIHRAPKDQNLVCNYPIGLHTAQSSGAVSTSQPIPRSPYTSTQH